MNYVFFGNNVPLAERLRKALGTGVIECITLLQMKTCFFPAEENGLLCIHEKTRSYVKLIPAIITLHKTFQNIYRKTASKRPGGENILFASRNGLCHLRVYL